MAIITDSIVDVGTYTTFNVGLSKLIGNYTADEIWNFPYCSSQWRFWQHIGDSTYSDFAPGGAGEPYNLQFPLKFTGRYESDGALNFDPGEIEYNNPGGIYCRIIWLYGTTTPITTLFPNNKRSITSGDNVKIITQMDMTKCRIHAKDVVPGDYVHPIGPVDQTNYINFDDFKIIENHDNVTDYMPPSSGVIFPAVMFQWNGKLHIFRLFQNSYNALDWSWFVSTNTEDKNVQGYEWDAQSLSFDGQQGVYFPINIYRQFVHLYPLSAESHESWTVDFEGNVGAIYQWWYGSHTGGRINPATEATYLEAISWYGMMFEHKGIQYKPIISDGYVTGYTSDMSVASDIDNWTGATNHNVPPSPPGPAPGYDDDPWSGVSFSGVGVGGAGAFAKCYYMTSTELANLRSWMNSNNVPEGFDPMAQIIGLSQVPVSLSGDDNTTVQFVNSSAVYDPGVTRLVDSGVSTQIAMGTPKRYSLGSVDIVRRMQERGEPYLDYDCQIELYLPLIGMFSLDTQAVMGRTITAEAVLDPISGTLAAYAYVSRDGQKLPIAYGSTTIGVDLPISSQQYSVSRAALKQANAQLGASILSSTLSFIAAATAGGKGSRTGAKTATGSTNGLAAAGIREAGADYMKASQAGNVFGDFMQWGRTIRQLSYGNNTAIAGSFGGSTAQWSYPFTPYVKIIRPRYEKPRNYNHSQGVPCVQTKKVGSCTGFIQCIGVDVSGITRATDLERQAIQAALANGVFAGGGS